MSMQTIDRKTACRINPFISDLYTEDTLGRCTNTLSLLSVMIANDKTGVDMEPLYLVFDTICKAMEWERRILQQNAALKAA